MKFDRRKAATWRQHTQAGLGTKGRGRKAPEVLDILRKHDEMSPIIHAAAYLGLSRGSLIDRVTAGQGQMRLSLWRHHNTQTRSHVKRTCGVGVCVCDEECLADSLVDWSLANERRELSGVQGGIYVQHLNTSFGSTTCRTCPSTIVGVDCMYLACTRQQR